MKKVCFVLLLSALITGCARNRHIVYLSTDKNIDINKPNVVTEYWEQSVYGKNLTYVNALCKQSGYKDAIAFANGTPSITYSMKRLFGLIGEELETTEIWCQK